MRGLVGLLALACGLFAVVSIFWFTLYGLYLAFSASIILGIIVLLVEPMPLIIGLLMAGFDYNLAQAIMNAVSGQ